MRDYSTYPTFPYIGLPMKAEDARIAERLIVPPVVAPFTIDWSLYGPPSSTKPNVGVTVTLATIQSSTGRHLDRIRSVYIDNLGSSNPVSVYFPDTQFAAACAAYSDVVIPVITDQMYCIVYGLGFITGQTMPKTRIHFANFILPDAASSEFNTTYPLELSSPTINRGPSINTPGYASRALGDQSTPAEVTFPADGVSITAGIFGSPLASGFVYLTHLYVAVTIHNPNNWGGKLFIESTGASGTLFSWQLQSAAGDFYFPLLDLQGMNMKLIATETWRIRSLGVGFGILASTTSFFHVTPVFTATDI